MSALRISVLTPDRLTPDHLRAWSEIQTADPTLSSPYFRPEFAAAVAAVRTDVQVGVIERAGEPVGFFPFQVGRLGAGIPVGGRLSDYHGLVARPGLELSAERLIEGCGLRSFKFDHLPASQTTFAAAATGTAPSHRLDLSAGFAAYVEERRAAKSGEVKESQQKYRKLERDLGPVRVELDSRDRGAFDALIAWKREQYRRTGFSDVFAFEWALGLLERIWEQRSPGFAGLLSTLSVDDRLLSVHFGMRSATDLHWWFPAYDVEFAKFGPGSMLLFEAARLAADAGVTAIDLGKGEEKYKTGFSSGAMTLIEGRVVRSRLTRAADDSWRSVRRWLKTSPLGAPARSAAKALRPMRERWSFG